MVPIILDLDLELEFYLTGEFRTLAYRVTLLNRILGIAYYRIVPGSWENLKADFEPVWCKYSNELYDIVIKRYYR